MKEPTAQDRRRLEALLAKIAAAKPPNPTAKSAGGAK